jgi:hypothetical protein
MLEIGELERTEEEVVLAYFKALLHHLHGRTEENQEEPESGNSMSLPIFKSYYSRM